MTDNDDDAMDMDGGDVGFSSLRATEPTGGLGAVAMDIILAGGGGAGTSSRVNATLASRLAHVLGHYTKLGDRIEPFHMHLLTTACVDMYEVPVPILDVDILGLLQRRRVDPSYWRVLYMYYYRVRHGDWPMGFRGIYKPMRRWYEHMINPINVSMEQFPYDAQWTQTRAHPMELMATRLLLDVLSERPIPVQPSDTLPLRVRQVLLNQCLRHEYGLRLYKHLRMSWGDVVQYQSIVLAWLGDMGYFKGTCTQYQHVEAWLLCLGVPMDWVATALLIQDRVDVLTQEQLVRALERFLTLNTSLPVHPRPSWIDRPRVRETFRYMVQEKMIPTDVFLQNYNAKTATERDQLMDLLNSVPELEEYATLVVMGWFQKMTLNK